MDVEILQRQSGRATRGVDQRVLPHRSPGAGGHHGAEAKLVEDLARGDLADVLHNSHAPSHVYVWEPYFPDLHSDPGSPGYKEVRCLILGNGGYSRRNMFCYTALVLEATGQEDEYWRVGLCSINPRQICDN
ncbi:uncharacterized protein Z519_08412 [Cladophialophora bantiana CBS 173.52]|uniref:Uncharacterized protein n=1 Tax=Cladophialophora bantiana (strain ATCC 10958 / CBS 173.52 / CDC B-1940 / NIH 8579) TaxID=1442370 RepID=A0A0D2I175_CLAB1|nr:uncharacterized protein Z519_08412 [Cladophialophora bantiana CBS 173.52]KIW90629.1 hypothetical protein Z519_08412 [Cladophialophora bantiana CBS 173.52]